MFFFFYVEKNWEVCFWEGPLINGKCCGMYLLLEQYTCFFRFLLVVPSPCLSIPSLLLPVPPQNAGPLWGKSFLWKISSGLSNIGELNFPSAKWTHSGKVDLGEWMLNPEL